MEELAGIAIEHSSILDRMGRTAASPGAFDRSRRAALRSLPRDSEFCFVPLRGEHWTSSARAYHWKAVKAAAGWQQSLYLATRHFAGWYMVNELEMATEDVAIALGHRTAGTSSAVSTDIATSIVHSIASSRRMPARSPVLRSIPSVGNHRPPIPTYRRRACSNAPARLCLTQLLNSIVPTCGSRAPRLATASQRTASAMSSSTTESASRSHPRRGLDSGRSARQGRQWSGA